ncbi:MAG TPA: penicillin acylase family protein, partial [Balneolaceae bacterium]|nr:penicillin acylase family protein [Balneolaceae bacterium]
MKRAFKIVLFLAILIIGIAAIGFYWTFYRPLPDYEATLQITELHKPVKIYWDSYGVPHIYAKNKHDLYLALGYVHAQDRLWQMTISQLAGQGRFAEFFGRSLVPVDKLQRSIGFWRVAQKIEKKLPDSTRGILEAYSKGVNRYVAEHSKSLPVQFALSGVKPIKWTPTHSLALARLMGWELNIAWRMELNYTLLSKKLPAEKFNELFPKHPISLEKDSLNKADEAFTTVLRKLLKLNYSYKKLMNLQADFIGSNAWAVGGSRTASGKPLLAGGPHLALNIPGKWYEVHLNLNGKNLSGETLPGAPAIVLGQNDVLAWSFTNVMLDDTDFYKEIIHPSDSTLYLADSLNGEAVFKPFELQYEQIKVKDGKDIVFTRRVSKHGPVVSDVLNNADNDKRTVIVMKWTGLKPSRELTALQKMGWSESFEEFKEGVKLFKVPAQNVTYADTFGNIALFTMGRIPKREGNPLLVRPGWEREYDWQGTVPFEKLPKIVNPESDWVANANNRVAQTPYYISAYWATNSRINRIEEYLSRNKRFTARDFQEMQLDTYSTYSKKITDIILPILTQNKDDFPIAVEYLSNWNYLYNRAETAATIMEVFKLQLSKNVFRDEMGKEAYKDFISFAAKPARALKGFLESGSRFFDVVNTAEAEARNKIIKKSMRQAINQLKE